MTYVGLIPFNSINKTNKFEKDICTRYYGVAGGYPDMLVGVSEGVWSRGREPLLESKKLLISPFSSKSASHKEEMNKADCKEEE